MRDFDFERHRADIQRQGRFIRMMVFLIFIVSIALTFSGIGLAVYALFYPEAVGEFVGRIINGFTATQ